MIAAAPDLKALQAEFVLKGLPDADGLQWVEAVPKAKDGQLQSLKVGFNGLDLAVLEINDSFGQRSRLTFSAVQTNVPLGANAFQFKPPTGADVIKQ